MSEISHTATDGNGNIIGMFSYPEVGSLCVFYSESDLLSVVAKFSEFYSDSGIFTAIGSMTGQKFTGTLVLDLKPQLPFWLKDLNI